MPAVSLRNTPVIGAALVTVFFWGSAFAAIRAGLHSYSPAHLAVLRFLSASAALVIYALLRRMRLPALRDLPKVFLLGLLGFAFYNIALNYGELAIASGPAAVLIQTLPIWTALAATVFLHERLPGLGWAGIVVSFSGVVVIGLGKDSGFGLNGGAGLILLASVSASAYNIIQKTMLAPLGSATRAAGAGDSLTAVDPIGTVNASAPPARRFYRPEEITAYSIWAGTLLLLPFSAGLPAAVRVAPLSDTLAAVYLGVAPAALAYATWAVVLSHLPASRASSILFVVPIVAFLVGWAWLGETPTWFDVAGGILAMGGVAIVNTLGRARRAAV
jgi:drug/metabolite transporter (DMT)-like permease